MPKILRLSTVPRKYFVVFFVAVAFLLFFFVYRSWGNGIETVTVGRETVSETVVHSGNVDSASASVIYALTNGVVDEVIVSNGDFVVKGQELMRIQSVGTEEERTAAYASYLAAQSLQNAAEVTKFIRQSELEQARRAIIDSVIAKNDFDDSREAGNDYTQEEIDRVDSAVTSARQSFSAAEKNYLDADTAIRSAQAQTAAALASYNASMDSTVLAPIDGRVVNLSVKRGDNTSAKSASSNGTTLLTIADFDSYSITVNVNEINIAKVSLGQKAIIVLDSFPDKEFFGTVSQIDDIGNEDQGLVTYRVEIDIVDPDPIIKAGMTALVSIEVGSSEGVIAVPLSALRIDGQERFVELVRRGSVRKQPVITGVRGSEYVEILSGLSEGDVVVVDQEE